jgi:plasmid stability protein
MAEQRRRKGSLLGVVAYVLVPGERRVRAARHFRKAGFETLKGLGELVRPERPPDPSGSADRERIEIE